MNFKKPKTFWTCLLLFILGAIITINIVRFNSPNFTPLAIFALLTGIGFIVAGYGLWIMKKWGAIIGIVLCVLKLIQIGFYSGPFNIYTPISFIIYIGIILIIILQDWKNLQ